MTTQTCEDVRQWIQAVTLSEYLQPPPRPLATHVARCPACRVALLMVLAEVLHLPRPLSIISCQHCQRDLAAFIEREAEASGQEVLRTYAHIWWHLWTCPDCAETYRLTRTLVNAEQRGEIKLPTIRIGPVARAPQRTELLRLTRSFLNQALPPPAAVAGAWRGDAGDMVLTEEETSDGRQINLSVHEKVDGTWRVTIQVEPPPSGYLAVQLGDAVYRAAFNPEGLAVIDNVPAALLTELEGPDMVVDIDHQEI